MPNQYARVKNTVKGEDTVRDDTEHEYVLVDELAFNTSTDNDFLTSQRNAIESHYVSRQHCQ